MKRKRHIRATLNVASANNFLPPPEIKTQTNTAAHLRDSLEKYCSRRASSAFEAFFHRSTALHCDSTGNRMWHGTWRRLVSLERRGKKAFHDLVSTRPFLYIYVQHDTCLELHEPVFVFTFSPFPPPPLYLLENSVRFEKPPRREKRELPRSAVDQSIVGIRTNYASLLDRSAEF